MENKRKKIVILNSYRLIDQSPFELVRIKEFLSGLASLGYRQEVNIDIEMIDTNSFEEMKKRLSAIKGEIDAIHAVGTANAIIAGQFSSRIPIVYYGAHPEGVGISECKKKNIKGFVLRLPFTANYKNFRFIRKLLPSIKDLYVPFYLHYLHPPFCTKFMSEKRRMFRNKNEDSYWFHMDSEKIRYKSLSKLCYIIGLNYHETVYENIDDLNTSIQEINPEGSLIMPYNDSVYCHQAPETIINVSSKKRIPVLWNNNPEATKLGALAAVAGCFKESGYKTGQMVGYLLNGNWNFENEIQHTGKSYASLNMDVAEKLGLKFPDDVLDYFDEIVSSETYSKAIV